MENIPQTIKKVVIWPNTSKNGMGDVVRQSVDFLRDMNADIYLPETIRGTTSEVEGVPLLSIEECMRRADFALVLGGDGTILSMAQYAAVEKLPILGINLGHVGFISELEMPELRAIKKVFDGEYQIDSRMMLRVEVIRGGEIVYKEMALNEAIVKTGSIFRISLLDILCDREEVCSLRGDGVIICTPTGTTAYSLAAGGPVVEPSAENISVVPICSHRIQAKSYIFSPHREICVVPRFFNNASVLVSCDGRKGIELSDGDRVYIRKADCYTRLIRVKGKSFYTLLNEKLSLR